MKRTKHPKDRFLFFCPWGNCQTGIVFGAIVWGTITWGAPIRFQSSREQFSVCACVCMCVSMCVCVWGGGWGTIIRGTNSIGINYPWGKLSQGQYSGSQLSRGAIAQVTIIREAIFLWRKCLRSVMDV